MASTLKQDLQRQRIKLIDPLTRSISKFWSWWSAELIATLPAATREAIANTNKRVVVSMIDAEWVFTSGNNSRTETIARLPIDATERPDVLPAQVSEFVFSLPTEKVLRRTLTLPLAAEENLREVLGFEMDRQTPFALHQVYYDYRITGRHTATNTITVDLVVSPRSIVDEFRTAMQKLDVPPDTVTTEDDNGEVLPVNLLPVPMRPTRQFSIPRLNTLLMTAGIMLLVVALALPPLLHRSEIALLEDEISVAETLGQSGLELQRDVERITKTSEFLTEKKRSSVMVLQILEEVSRVLPDNTWLTRFDVNESEVQLQGQSTSAADLIQLLESSTLFKDARFRSPVVQVPRTDKERFHLSVQLETAEAT